MYGLLSLPKKTSRNDRLEYRKHMCALCDSLHENYGYKGRFFTNYDLTTISIIISALKVSIPDEISEPSNIFCTRPFSFNKQPAIFSFYSAVSIMMAYCQRYDDICEKNCINISKIFKNKVDIADKTLRQYGLNKNYFESIIQCQHKLETDDVDLDLLVQPTGELIASILKAASIILKLDNYISQIQELGKELGKLIYIYDGIFDYQNDKNGGTFNCVQSCFVKNCTPSPEIAEKIVRYISKTKENISKILNNLDFPNGSSLVKTILLQDIAVKEKKHGGKVGNLLILTKSFNLNLKVIYGIISGSMIIQTAAAASEGSYCCFGYCNDSTIGCLCCLCCCGALGWCINS